MMTHDDPWDHDIICDSDIRMFITISSVQFFRVIHQWGLDIGSRVFKIGIIRAAFNHGYHVLSTLFLSKDLAQRPWSCYDLWQSLVIRGPNLMDW